MQIGWSKILLACQPPISDPDCPVLVWNKTHMDLKRRKNRPTVDISSTVQQREPGPVLQVEDHPHLR